MVESICPNLHLYNALSRAHVNACWFIMMAEAVYTERFIDDIAILSWRNSVYRAFWFASSTKNTGIGNAMGHKYLILGIIMNTFKTERSPLHVPVTGVMNLIHRGYREI